MKESTPGGHLISVGSSERSGMNLRSALRPIRNAVILLLVLWVAFIGAQLIGAAVPDRPIAQQLQQSIADGLYERSYPPNGVGGQHDAYTDCVAAGTGLGEEAMSVWERALMMPRIASCTNGGVEAINAIAAGEDPAHQLYLRYWAGYAAVFRPALAVGGMAAMNAVALSALALGLFAMWTALSRRTSPLIAAALSLPLLLTSDVLATPGGSSEHALSLGVAFGGVAAVAWASSRGLAMIFLTSVGAGAVFNFFDLLNNPNLAWTLAAAAGALCLAARGASASSVAASAGVAAAGWMTGFAAAFIERWITAILAAGPDAALEQVVENVANRSGLGDQSGQPVETGFGHGSWANVMFYADMPLSRIGTALVLLFTVVCLALAIRGAGRTAALTFLAAASPSLVVPLWYEVMSNHSQIHAFFMYRAIPAAAGVVLAAAVTVLLVSRTASRGRGMASNAEAASQ